MAYYNVIESIEPRIVQNLGELKAYIDEISLRLPEDTPIKAHFDHAIEVKPMEENTTKHKALHISECDESWFQISLQTTSACTSTTASSTCQTISIFTSSNRTRN